jgi:hypothetical protein
MAEYQAGGFFQGLRGRVGNAVYYVTADGRTFVREAPRPNNPQTAAQQLRRANFHKAVAYFNSLTMEEHEAWRQWAARVSGSGVRGSGKAPRANTAFTSLAVTFLLLNPSQWPPRLPPSSVFLGDYVGVVAAPEPSGVVFTSDRPNAPGVTTMLLLQRLRSVGEAPSEGRARFQQAYAFADGALSVTVPAPPGHYACAIKLAEVATGQTTALEWVGRVQVVG